MGVVTGGGGGSALRTATATLTDAQIKALPTTAVQLVGDPGGGAFIVPLVIVYRMLPTAYVNYTNIAANALLFAGNLSDVFFEATGAEVSGLLANSGFGGSVTSTTQNLASFNTSAVGGFADSTLAGALTLKASNGGSAFTGGDVGNSLQVAVSYLTFRLSGSFA